MGRFDSQVRATSIASFFRPIVAAFTILSRHKNRLRPRHGTFGDLPPGPAKSFWSIPHSGPVLGEEPSTKEDRLTAQLARRR